jgi:hypothetical protein
MYTGSVHKKHPRNQLQKSIHSNKEHLVLISKITLFKRGESSNIQNYKRTPLLFVDKDQHLQGRTRKKKKTHPPKRKGNKNYTKENDNFRRKTHVTVVTIILRSKRL